MNPMGWSPLEWSAVVVTVINVYLAARASVWNFAFGLLSVALYGFILWDQKLYANFGLNVFYYLPMTLIGWWVWLRAGPKKDDDLPIQLQPLHINAIWLGIALGAAIPLQMLLQKLNGSATWPDAITTSFSLVGQYYLTRKFAEQWLFWIVANFIYAFVVFPQLKMMPSAILYGVLLVMAVYGWVSWLRAARTGASHA
jgi:nicotinamide mononucleotide transporter